MSNQGAHMSAVSDQSEIQSLIERWAQAVREENRPAIRAHHANDVLMFDVPPPFLSKGIDAYMETWELFFAHVEKPVTFYLTDLNMTAGLDVAFATAIGHCVNIDSNGAREPLDFRLTIGLRKIDGNWQIVHEHHSLPAL